MTIRQAVAGIGAGVMAIVAVLAGAVIRLVTTDPVAVAAAAGEGNAADLAAALVRILVRSLLEVISGR